MKYNITLHCMYCTSIIFLTDYGIFRDFVTFVMESSAAASLLFISLRIAYTYEKCTGSLTLLFPHFLEDLKVIRLGWMAADSSTPCVGACFYWKKRKEGRKET